MRSKDEGADMIRGIFGGRPVIVERVLDISKLQGRKDCEILFVEFCGHYPALCGEAKKRNIVITSISKKRYKELTEQ